MSEKSKIGQNQVVTIDYELKDQEGNLIEKTEQQEPLEYIHGQGQIIPGLEKALEGKEAGESTHVDLPPEQGYGDRDPRQVFTVPRERFDFDVTPGQILHAQLSDGQIIPLQVLETSEQGVTLDGNHPLAGKTLAFDVKVVDVRQASQEELRQGIRRK